ncbi:MAG: tripartite tricarboxylate transporter TctB family protein [Desulfobacteraceae bacterium]|nr:MAG: tripartite tricarboxylate transporter TctB family protein [Desulfobacteraceae bacterium]
MHLLPVPRSRHATARSLAVLKGELVFSVLIVLISAVLFWVAQSFVGPGIYAKLGPEFWPTIVLAALMILGVIVSVGTARKITREKAWAAPLMTMDRGTVRLFAAIGLILGYLTLIQVTGFILTTPPFMVLFMILLGEKSKGWMASVSVGMTAVIVILFTKAMYVPLPRGMGLFRNISLLFY